MLDSNFLDFVDISNQIETSIADTILNHYYALRSKLKDARTSYMRSRIQTERNKSLSISLNISSSREMSAGPALEKNKARHKIYTKKIQRSLDKKDKTIVFKQHIRPKGVSEEFFDRNYRGVEPCQSIFHEGITKKQFMHLNHPPSKIIVDKWKSYPKGSVDERSVKARSRLEQKYRLLPRDIKEIYKKTPFREFYSGGPPSRSNKFKVDCSDVREWTES